MNILQQYQKAVKEREQRLGRNDWQVTHQVYRIGEEFEYLNGYSHKFRVGDRLTLCCPRCDIDCIYGKAKVIRRLSDGETVVLKRVS